MLGEEEAKDPRRRSHLSLAEMAEMCDVNIVQVGKWIRSGELRAHRPPRGHYQVSQRDFLDFLRRNAMPIPVELQVRPTLRVLVVDDEPMVRAVVANILETGGDMEVAVAADGFEAGVLVAELRPEVVVLDLRMPGIDGGTVCRRIKSDPRTAHTRILFLTGHEDPDSLALIRACGADGYVPKPFIAQDLIEAVRGLGGTPAPSEPAAAIS